MKQILGHWTFPWHRSNRGAFPPIKPTDTLNTEAWLKPRLDPASQARFLSDCWGLTVEAADLEKELPQYACYIRHYERSCLHLHPSLRGITHQDFCKIAKRLSSDSRNVCEDAIQSQSGWPCLSPAAATECIEFIGKGILLLDFSDWKMSETLAQFITRVVASHSQETERFQLPVSFNARTLEIIAGVDIKWTRDLLSHLKVGPTMSSLSIFHHAKVLDLYEKSSFRSVFPDQFFIETRSTLSLMLPIADKKSRKWFTRKQTDLTLDMAAGNCPYLRGENRHIQHFNFWRDRLIIAKEMFDSSQPSGLVQFWRDDRNPVQWWTFWIAIVVFLLTLVGVLESALQVYKAYYPSR